jgi:hypothetical protein
MKRNSSELRFEPYLGLNSVKIRTLYVNFNILLYLFSTVRTYSLHKFRAMRKEGDGDN